MSSWRNKRNGISRASEYGVYGPATPSARAPQAATMGVTGFTNTAGGSSARGGGSYRQPAQQQQPAPPSWKDEQTVAQNWAQIALMDRQLGQSAQQHEADWRLKRDDTLFGHMNDRDTNWVTHQGNRMTFENNDRDRFVQREDSMLDRFDPRGVTAAMRGDYSAAGANQEHIQKLIDSGIPLDEINKLYNNGGGGTNGVNGNQPPVQQGQQGQPPVQQGQQVPPAAVPVGRGTMPVPMDATLDANGIPIGQQVPPQQQRGVSAVPMTPLPEGATGDGHVDVSGNSEFVVQTGVDANGVPTVSRTRNPNYQPPVPAQRNGVNPNGQPQTNDNYGFQPFNQDVVPGGKSGPDRTANAVVTQANAQMVDAMNGDGKPIEIDAGTAMVMAGQWGYDVSGMDDEDRNEFAQGVQSGIRAGMTEDEAVRAAALPFGLRDELTVGRERLKNGEISQEEFDAIEDRADEREAQRSQQQSDGATPADGGAGNRNGVKPAVGNTAEEPTYTDLPKDYTIDEELAAEQKIRDYEELEKKGKSKLTPQEKEFLIKNKDAIDASRKWLNDIDTNIENMTPEIRDKHIARQEELIAKPKRTKAEQEELRGLNYLIKEAQEFHKWDVFGGSLYPGGKRQLYRFDQRAKYLVKPPSQETWSDLYHDWADLPWYLQYTPAAGVAVPVKTAQRRIRGNDYSN